MLHDTRGMGTCNKLHSLPSVAQLTENIAWAMHFVCWTNGSEERAKFVPTPTLHHRQVHVETHEPPWLPQVCLPVAPFFDEGYLHVASGVCTSYVLSCTVPPALYGIFCRLPAAGLQPRLALRRITDVGW